MKNSYIIGVDIGGTNTDAVLVDQNEKIICTECNHNLPYTNHHILSGNDTTKKFYGIIPIEFSASMLYFHKKGIVQNLIHNLKYKKHQEIGTILGEWYAKDLESVANIKTVSEIIPVPLHKKRLEERGYNQITTFCEALSKELKIPYNPNLLYRSRYSKTQTKKDKENRKDIANSLFDVNLFSCCLSELGPTDLSTYLDLANKQQ